tara:strand:- start:3465 stop:4412 length:948 start_codon:yes stop_codon:yes gene_type:complete
LLSNKKNIFSSIEETIGRTPLVLLRKIKKKYNLKGNIIAKLEFFNPLGSVKDRIGLAMINKAEKENKIDVNSTIIEATSGNTGIALAFICASRGYKLILTMPDSMSLERKKMLKFLGATIMITPKSRGMLGAIEKAKEIRENIKDSIILDQFSNKENYKIHFKTTAEEIWKDTGGEIDCFISGVGTGGTITGVGKFLKMKNKKIEIIAVEPEDSPVLSTGEPGSHIIQGLGAGFVPKILETKFIDRILPISNNSALEFSRNLARVEGIAAGISSGAVLAAAIEVNEEVKMKGKNTIIMIPSFAERYLSTELFNEI